MKGKIKTYSPSVNAGLVQAVDGRNYPFTKSQWMSDDLPANNQAVELEKNSERIISVRPR